jgi:hypothetical protein
VGGAFLSLAYLDLPYYIMGFVVSAGMLERKRAKERAQAARGATAFALRSDGQAGPGRAGLAKK